MSKHKTHHYSILLILLLVLLGILSYVDHLESVNPDDVVLEEEISPDELIEDLTEGLEPLIKIDQEVIEEEPPEEQEITLPTQKIVVIEIKNLKFNPGEITIEKGTTIEWINNEEARTHNLYSLSVGVPFNSRRLEPGQSYTYTFNEEGIYPYSDSLFKFMKGKIIVE